MATSTKKPRAPADTAGAPSAAQPAVRLNGHTPAAIATQAATSSATASAAHAAGPSVEPKASSADPDASSAAPVHRPELTAPKPPAPKLIARCTTCRGEDVLLDAWASWSFERQEWVLGHTFDHAFCVTCETECKIECVPVPVRTG